MGNITYAVFGNRKICDTKPLYQYDYGQVLKIKGVNLPEAYEVHFSNAAEAGDTKTVIGSADGVAIPDEYLTSGDDVYAFVFLHDGESDGETEYKARIPVNKRPQPSNATPTPVQQDTITQAIAALNAGVERAEEAQDAWENMSAVAETEHRAQACSTNERGISATSSVKSIKSNGAGLTNC